MRTKKTFWIQSIWLVASALVAGGLIGCTHSEEIETFSTSRTIEYPEFAEGFRWREWRNDEHARANRCLEVLEFQHREVIMTVYRDSLSFREDPVSLQGKAVVLSPEAEGIATLSSTHVALLEAWDDSLQNWSGGGYLEFVQSDVAEGLVTSGQVVDFGGSPEWNHEALLATNYRVFCIYPYGNPMEHVERSGDLPIVPVLEYLEPTPLGRAEWMKALAWMVGEEAFQKAGAVFDEIAKAYMVVKNLPLPTQDSLMVFTGSVNQGEWSAPGGGSLIATFLADAGVRYFLDQDSGTENVVLSMEEMMEMKTRADAWGMVMFHPTSGTMTHQMILEQDPRNQLFVPDSERIFVANTARCDYFGWWVAHPEAMLKNLKTLFYGERDGGGRVVTNEPMCFEWAVH
jgi:iron complex transport system substrate-binding protein